VPAADEDSTRYVSAVPSTSGAGNAMNYTSVGDAPARDAGDSFLLTNSRCVARPERLSVAFLAGREDVPVAVSQ